MTESEQKFNLELENLREELSLIKKFLVIKLMEQIRSLIKEELSTSNIDLDEKSKDILRKVFSHKTYNEVVESLKKEMNERG